MPGVINPSGSSRPLTVYCGRYSIKGSSSASVLSFCPDLQSQKDNWSGEVFLINSISNMVARSWLCTLMCFVTTLVPKTSQGTQCINFALKPAHIPRKRPHFHTVTTSHPDRHTTHTIRPTNVVFLTANPFCPIPSLTQCLIKD